MTTRRVVSVSRNATIALLLAASLPLAHAAADDDYRAGLRAYQGGDVVGAMQALRPAAEAGHAKAQALLAFVLERSGSLDDAERYYRMAAAQGDLDAQVSLAQLLLGRGARGEHDAEALALFQRAAAAGHGQAIDAVAEAYVRKSLGLTPAARDNMQAVAAITKSAEQGSLPSIDALAAAYRTGDYGLAANAAEAARWQAKADLLRKQRAANSTQRQGSSKDAGKEAGKK